MDRKNEKGALLGIMLIVPVIIIFTTIIIFDFPDVHSKGRYYILHGAWITYTAILIFLSYFFRHKSFLFHYLARTSNRMRGGKPNDDWIIIWSIFFFIIGNLGLLNGLSLIIWGKSLGRLLTGK